MGRRRRSLLILPPGFGGFFLAAQAVINLRQQQKYLLIMGRKLGGLLRLLEGIVHIAFLQEELGAQAVGIRRRCRDLAVMVERETRTRVVAKIKARPRQVQICV